MSPIGNYLWPTNHCLGNLVNRMKSQSSTNGHWQWGSPYYPLSSQTTERPSPIRFYHKHDPHYGFTNFSNHPVYYQGVMYPTSEHLFQSLKFLPDHPNVAKHIRSRPRPSDAWSEAHRLHIHVRSDWKQINISKMDEVLLLKFTQHPDLKAELLATGNAELIENSDSDSFWGVGADGQGRNELGKALMELRDKLRKTR